MIQALFKITLIKDDKGYTLIYQSTETIQNLRNKIIFWHSHRRTYEMYISANTIISTGTV